MSDEDYITVYGTIGEIRPQAVLFSVGTPAHGCRTSEWIPRSLIHGADERTLDSRFAGERSALRIFRWKVKALGWESTRRPGAASGDLFEQPASNGAGNHGE